MINKGQIFPEMTRMRGRYFGEDKCEGQGIRGKGNHSDEYRRDREVEEKRYTEEEFSPINKAMFNIL